MLRFTMMARLEFHRSPSLRENPGPVIAAVHAFYASMVDDAIVRGEIPAGTDAMAVVHMSFYAGFIADENDMVVIAEQLHQLMTHGLLAQQEIGRALTIRHAWPGLTGSSSSRRSAIEDATLTFFEENTSF